MDCSKRGRKKNEEKEGKEREKLDEDKRKGGTTRTSEIKEKKSRLM